MDFFFFFLMKWIYLCTGFTIASSVCSTSCFIINKHCYLLDKKHIQEFCSWTPVKLLEQWGQDRTKLLQVEPETFKIHLARANFSDCTSNTN